ncbi:DUF5719 family protein [Actinopolymorpha alba]|uniref:DUF5719 family protein n=1 Tax=Actinopolymorpha alba TaxID=533267 RepID=UPI00035C82FC|nr:DUF5719 family protein [Actinopolymorpha alba]
MNNPLIRIGVIAGILLVLVGGTALATPSLTNPRKASEPTRRPLDRAALVCPESSYTPDQTTTDVGAVAAPAGTDVEGADGADGSQTQSRARLDLAPLVGTGKPFATVDRRERLAAYAVRASKVPPVLVSAQGAVAPGATAGQITRTGEGSLRGLSETPCVTPGSEFWFVGAGSELGRHGRLYLSNADEAVAQVDLRLYDEKGPITTDGTRGIAIAARSQRVVELDKLAPTSKRLAVAVVAQRGRVSAALRDDAVSGDTPIGVDWIPSAVPPAKELLVPGIASGSGERVLTLVAPGDSTAVVDLSILAAQGSFQPVDLGHLEIEPGTVAQVRLHTATQKQAAAVRIISDAPVTASLRNEFGPADGPRDVAYAAATRSLSGPAVVPVTVAGDKKSASLLMSTPSERPVNATVVMLGDDGRQVGSTKVTVKGGSTVETKLTAPKDVKRYTLVVTSEGGGPVYATRLQVENASDGPMVSSWPLSSAATTAVRPIAHPDLAAGIGVEESGDGVFR